jgi:hypothetical protein
MNALYVLTLFSCYCDESLANHWALGTCVVILLLTT